MFCKERANGLRPAPHALRGVPALGRAAGSRPTGKMLRRRKLPEIAADWASERQANIAQPKRVSAGHPQRRVHALLAAVILQVNYLCNELIKMCIWCI